MKSRMTATAISLLLLLPGCDRQLSETPHRATARDKTILVVRDKAPATPGTIDLGEVTAGSPARMDVTLRNLGDEPFVVERFESSCPCIGVEPLPISVQPGRSASMTVTFDPNVEPDFRGACSSIWQGSAEAEKLSL